MTSAQKPILESLSAPLPDTPPLKAYLWEHSDRFVCLTAQEVGALKFKNEASLASSTTPGHLDLPGVVQLARSSEAKILTKADAVNQYGDSPLPSEQSESGPE